MPMFIFTPLLGLVSCKNKRIFRYVSFGTVTALAHGRGGDICLYFGGVGKLGRIEFGKLIAPKIRHYLTNKRQ